MEASWKLLIVLIGMALVGLLSSTSSADVDFEVYDELSPPFVSPVLVDMPKGTMVARLQNGGFKMQPHEVLNVLYRVKDMAATEVIEDVTVSDLLAMNTIRTSDCTKDEFDRRAKICMDRTFYGSVRPYCQYCLKSAEKFCQEHLKKMITSLLDTSDYINGVAVGI
jgi:hypothetical protein